MFNRIWSKERRHTKGNNSSREYVSLLQEIIRIFFNHKKFPAIRRLYFMWWFRTQIPKRTLTIGRLKQEDCELKGNLGYRVRNCVSEGSWGREGGRREGKRNEKAEGIKRKCDILSPLGQGTPQSLFSVPSPIVSLLCVNLHLQRSFVMSTEWDISMTAPPPEDLGRIPEDKTEGW